MSTDISTDSESTESDSTASSGTETVRVEASEREARELAEAARDIAYTRPSFAKELYLGRFDLALIHPHPRGEGEAVAEGEEFLAKLEEYCRTLDGRLIEREAKIPDEYVKGFADLGVFGMKIPRKYGGLGLSMLHYGRALMLVGSVHPSIGALVSAHNSIGVPEPVKMFGTDAQKQEYLPRCAAGAVTAFLLTEPDVGSDPARMGSTARLSEDGREYILDGVKLWTTNGVIAELVVVMATVPKHEGGRGGISAFVVDTSSPGVTVENRNNFMGLKGIENGVTRFHDVRVPVENRLGKEGEGLKIALTTLNVGRLSIPAMCAGAGKWSLKIAREWSAERVHGVGRWASTRRSARRSRSSRPRRSRSKRSSSCRPSWPTPARRTSASRRRSRSCGRARWRTRSQTSSSRSAADAASRPPIRSPRGVNERWVLNSSLRDMRINRIFEGSTEIMHLLIAREAVDTHLKAAGDLANVDADMKAKAKAAVDASGFYAKWLPKLVAGKGQVPGSYDEFGALAKHLRYVERRSRKVARQTFYAMGRWQAKMEYKQAFLGRIVDIGAELFAMAASCTRAEMIRQQDPQQGKAAYELAEAFCEQSRLRIEELFDRLWTNSDDTDRALSDKVLEGGYTWLEEGVIDPSEGTGPWIATWEPGPSKADDVHRSYR